MAWPQITLIILITINVTIALVQHGQSKGNFNFFFASIDAALLVWILNAGGFFGK